MDLATAVSTDYGSMHSRIPEHHELPCFERRHRLILDNMVEVCRIARRIHARLPGHVLLEDLVHSGVLGLIEAVDKFDPTRNVSLQAYAQFRIRGAILDGLRELDWSSRFLRRQARCFEQARSELIAKLGRAPSEPEVADQLGLRLDKFQHILANLHSLTAGAQQGPLEFSSQEEEWVAPSNNTNEDPFQMCARTEAIRMLTAAIDTLGEKERQSLALYYFEEKTMKEVARVLNLHESRVSQIIGAALNRLRIRLREAKGRPDKC
jgi:RNA polymerase sigma factor FliA